MTGTAAPGVLLGNIFGVTSTRTRGPIMNIVELHELTVDKSADSLDIVAAMSGVSVNGWCV